MKKIFLTIIALVIALVTSAQTIKVYEYDDNGNLSSTPTYTSSKKVKVIFTDEKEHEYVDLGLPSGTLWATCNVGANIPEEYGLYFAWGETIGYTGDTFIAHQFNWEKYKWCKGSYDTITKYCTNSFWGTIDNNTELESEDDVVTTNWGDNWCMPTREQQEELVNSSYTDTEWITLNGVNGRLITSKKNGKTIFLPAAGCCPYSSRSNVGFSGYYWSRSLYADNSSCAYLLDFVSGGIGLTDADRCSGYSVRPVRVQSTYNAVKVSSIFLNKSSLSLNVEDVETLSATITPENASNSAVTWISSDDNIATVDATGKVTAKAVGSATIYVVANDGSGVKATCSVNVNHEYVDLGLPSGTLWATYNVGASKPEEYGDYFAWGETAPKNEYSYNTYKWCKGSNKTFTKYCTSSGYGTVDNKTELDSEDDAATVNWGSNWCIPTEDQIKELYNSSYTTTKWMTLNGISGRMITSNKNGKTLFLPASGYYSDTSHNDTGTSGCFSCWSRSINKYNCSSTYMLYSNSEQITFATVASRCIGLSVRPVRVKK